MQASLFFSIFVPIICLLCSLEFRRAECQCSLIGELSMVVDGIGKRGFESVQAAIWSVPDKNHQWTFIELQPGTYRERVTIPENKQCIILLGSGTHKTIITYNISSSISLRNSTFSVFADNFVAADITFQNEYNVAPVEITNPDIKQAIALEVFGDKSSFYNCTFKGYQDTLWDARGRHYFKDCKISGAIDFIFGQGQSIYEINRKHLGYLTAQGREKETDTNGFVFKNCSVMGHQTAYLGRAWKPYSRVLFFESYLNEVVSPEGWLAWRQAGHEDLITFAEKGNCGPGSSMENRVTWEKKVTDSEIKELIPVSFIDKEGWLEYQQKLLELVGASSLVGIFETGNRIQW